MPRISRFLECGFIDIISLVAVLFLIITTATGVYIVNKENANFDIRNKAAAYCSVVGDSCLDPYYCCPSFDCNTQNICVSPTPIPTPTKSPTPIPSATPIVCSQSGGSCLDPHFCCIGFDCNTQNICIAPTPFCTGANDHPHVSSYTCVSVNHGTYSQSNGQDCCTFGTAPNGTQTCPLASRLTCPDNVTPVCTGTSWSCPVVVQACTVGKTQCSGTESQTCSTGGIWISQHCVNGCTNGVCNQPITQSIATNVNIPICGSGLTCVSRTNCLSGETSCKQTSTGPTVCCINSTLRDKCTASAPSYQKLISLCTRGSTCDPTTGIWSCLTTTACGNKSDGTIECNAGGVGYNKCVNGTWTSLACPTGWVCPAGGSSCQIAQTSCGGKPNGTIECNASGVGYNLCKNGMWTSNSCPVNMICPTGGKTCQQPPTNALPASFATSVKCNAQQYCDQLISQGANQICVENPVGSNNYFIGLVNGSGKYYTNTTCTPSGKSSSGSIVIAHSLPPGAECNSDDQCKQGKCYSTNLSLTGESVRVCAGSQLEAAALADAGSIKDIASNPSALIDLALVGSIYALTQNPGSAQYVQPIVQNVMNILPAAFGTQAAYNCQVYGTNSNQCVNGAGGTYATYQMAVGQQMVQSATANPADWWDPFGDTSKMGLTSYNGTSVGNAVGDYSGYLRSYVSTLPVSEQDAILKTFFSSLGSVPSNLTSQEEAAWMLQRFINENATVIQGRTSGWENLGYQPGSAASVYPPTPLSTQLQNIPDPNSYYTTLDNLANNGATPEQLLTAAKKQISQEGIIILENPQANPATGRITLPDGSEMYAPNKDNLGTYLAPRAFAVSDQGTKFSFPSNYTSTDYITSQNQVIVLNTELQTDPAGILTTLSHEYGHAVEGSLTQISTTFGGEVQTGFPSTEALSSLFGVRAAMLLAPANTDAATMLMYRQAVLNQWVTTGGISNFQFGLP